MSKKNKQKPGEQGKAEQPVTDTETAAPAAETEKAEPAAPANEEPKAEESKAETSSVTLTAEEFQAAKEHIAKLQKERDDTVALLQRNQADFDNYRRRNAQARAESYEEGKRDCIQKLLPVLDNFDRALENEGASDASWREGVKLVAKQLITELQKLGLSEIEAAGKFDPNLHNAVMQEKTDGKQSGEIVAVFQKGYQVGDRIIRHSMVKVAE